MSEKKETPESENTELPEEQTQTEQAEEQEQPEQQEQTEGQEQLEQQGQEEGREQSEQQEQEEEVEHQEHHPVKQSSGSSAAFLATLIALGAIGASYYLWQQQQELRKDVSALDSSVSRLVDVVEQHNAQQLARIDQLSEHHHTQLEQQLAQVEQQMQTLSDRLGQKRSQWMISEAEYLVRIAAHRLILERDTLSARAALSEAAYRLRQLEDPSLNNIIGQINRDITAINAVIMPDRDAIASRIAQIASEIPNWPFATEGSQPQPDQTESEQSSDTTQKSEQSRWQQVLSKIWNDMKSLVTIRRNDEVDKPVTDTEHRFYLQQNLRLKLESARLALFSGQGQTFHNSLNEASNWLQRYFDTSDPSVADALASLQQLNGIELNPPLPSLNNTVILLQKAVIAAQPTTELPPATGMTKQPALQPAPATGQPEPSQKSPATEPAPAEESAPQSEPPSSGTPVPDKSETPPETTPPATVIPSKPQGVAL